jgi:F-type H+-transporting ATPase subunit delta
MKINRQSKREAKQLFHLCLVKGLLDETRARQVVQRVAAAGRRNCQAILAQFLRLVKLDRTQHTANIESAVPLDPDLQASTQADLERRYGPGITISYAYRPALIGGMRIQIGSDVYDGSVLAGLTTLEKSF